MDRNVSRGTRAMPESGVTWKMEVEWWEILPSLAMPCLKPRRGHAGSKVDPEVNALEGGSDHHRQGTHSCLADEGLEVTCDVTWVDQVCERQSSRKAAWWEGCLIRPTGSWEDDGCASWWGQKLGGGGVWSCWTIILIYHAGELGVFPGL